jgi:hypothetical protein
VEWITPSTLTIPVMRHNTHIKHVAQLVWLCKKVSLTISKVLEISKINPKFPLGASRSKLSLTHQRILKIQAIWATFIQKPVIKVIN